MVTSRSKQLLYYSPNICKINSRNPPPVGTGASAISAGLRPTLLVDEKKVLNTKVAPIQYKMPGIFQSSTICTSKAIGIVKPKPTVTSNGVVNSIAYAHETSEMGSWHKPLLA